MNLAEELGNVSRACKTMGLSRDTFYRYKAAVEEGGIDNLFDKSRRQSNLKNRVDELTEQTVLSHAIEYPAHGQIRVSNELRKAGVFVSPSGVRSIWLRNGLANFKDRLKALEAKMAGQGLILTEAQVAALETKRQDDEVSGEIDTAHPGCLQKDLDEWLDYYNNQRTHQGKMCCGQTPMVTLIDGKSVWKEKFPD